jgi:hypothetical protein
MKPEPMELGFAIKGRNFPSVHNLYLTEPLTETDCQQAAIGVGGGELKYNLFEGGRGAYIMQRSQSTFKITILGSGKRGLYRLSGILNI